MARQVFKASILANAAILPLLAYSQQSPISSTPADQKCAVEGRVTNIQTGDPLKKVQVRLTKVSNSTYKVAVNMYSTTSNADGSFRLPDVEPGSYELSGERTGYLLTQYGAQTPDGSGTVLTLTAGQRIADLSLRLFPQGVISGKVLDEDGDPAESATVSLMARTWVSGKARYIMRGTATTNDLGEFRFSDLEPGTYYVDAKAEQVPKSSDEVSMPAAKPQVEPVRTFYPEATTLDSATPIKVRPGQEVPGINIRLHSGPTYHVRGRVTGMQPDDQDERLMLTITRHSDAFGPMTLFSDGRSALKADGTFDLDGITPGSYSLLVTKISGRMRVVGIQPVDVTAADLNDVVVNIVPPGSLQGHFRVESNSDTNTAVPNFSNIRVSLNPSESSWGGRTRATVAADGSFFVDGISAGKYIFRIASLPAGMYVKSVLLGGQDVLGKEVDFSQGGSGRIEIVLRSGAAEVDGKLQAASSPSDVSAHPLSGALVAIISDESYLDGSGVYSSSVDQNGNFSVRQLPPGHYHAYAFAQADVSTLQVAEVEREIQTLGVDVEVKENDRKQIQLPVISADDFRQMLARVGMDAQ